MVATQVESPTNSPASEQVMDILTDVKALTAAPAVEAKETQTADTENETVTPAVEAPEPEGATVHSITTNEDAAANVNVEDNGTTDSFEDSKPSAEAAIASETERLPSPKSPDMEADDVSAEAACVTEAESPSTGDIGIPLARKRTILACEPLQEGEPPTKNSKEGPLWMKMQLVFAAFVLYC
jgi:hypothetical protein